QELEKQQQLLDRATTSDERRSVTEQARHLRQAATRLRDQPDHRAAVLDQRLKDLVGQFDAYARKEAPDNQRELFDQRAAAAENEIKRQSSTSLDRAEEVIDEMQSMYTRLLWEQPAYVVWLFRETAQERYLATDKAVFDNLIQAGEEALARNDISALRRI